MFKWACFLEISCPLMISWFCFLFISLEAHTHCYGNTNFMRNLFWNIINPFLASIPILYPIKAPSGFKGLYVFYASHFLYTTWKISYFAFCSIVLPGFVLLFRFFFLIYRKFLHVIFPKRFMWIFFVGPKSQIFWTALLNHFTPLVFSYTPWKIRKPLLFYFFQGV